MAASGLSQSLPKMPTPLHKGDKIAIVSLASTPGENVATGAARTLEQWGFKTTIGRHVNARHHIYAGTIEERLEDFMAALRDPEVKAIISTRGGYGSALLLTRIPLDTLRRYPKWIVGYSDITSIHSALVRAGVCSLHANMGGALAERGPLDPVNLMLRNVLMGDRPTHTCPPNAFNHPGEAGGIVVGGNMAVFTVNVSGSKDYDFLDRDYIADKDIIFFFEDVGESLPRVNSMLTELKLKGVMDRVRGIIVGRFTDYDPSNGYSSMDEMLAEYLADYKDIPICFDFPVSHDELWNYPMIEGAEATLTVTPTGATLRYD